MRRQAVGSQCRTGSWLRVGCVFLVLSLTVASGAWGQDPAPAAVPSAALRRQLAGHTFLSSKFSPDPFTSTYVASETGAGYGSAPGQTFTLCGETVCPGTVTTDTYALGAFTQMLAYQYGIFDWWAVHLNATVLVYTGLNGSAVAGVGTNLNGGASLGTTMSWKLGDRFRLGGALDVGVNPTVFVDIVKSVVEARTSGLISPAVNTSARLTVAPTVVGSWAIARPLGLTFSLGYQYAAILSETQSAAGHLLTSTVLLDFDMDELHWVPMGLFAGFGTSLSLTDATFLNFRYQFGIFYTGVKPLNVGLELAYTRAPLVGHTEIFLSSFVGLLLLQYNFN